MDLEQAFNETMAEMEKPKLLMHLGNITPFRLTLQEYIDFIDSDDYCEDQLGDYKNAIFEAAMELNFGKDVWNWINAKCV